MPELAEVAIYAHDMNQLISNKPVKSVGFNGDKRFKNRIITQDLQQKLKGLEGEVISFSSLGKTLYLQTKQKITLQIKLGMTGMFQTTEPSIEEQKKHNFLSLHFDGITLYYLDFRRFSRFSNPKKEPLAIGGFSDSKGFWIQPKNELLDIINSLTNFSKKPRITWLLENGSVTGIGNYMANEALGRLNVSPFAPCCDENEALQMLIECGKVAKESYKFGGNSFKGGYYRLNGEKGSFSSQCQFYRKKGVPCYKYRGRPVYSLFKPA